MKYKRAEDPDRIQTVTLHSPNDELRVAQKGLYEITEVMSSILKLVILVLNNLRSSDHRLSMPWNNCGRCIDVPRELGTKAFG